jgi:hypothetical protein
MRVTSRIADSTDPVSRIPTIVMVALESRPILDGIGSAFIAQWYATGQSAIMGLEIHCCSKDSIGVIF